MHALANLAAQDAIFVCDTGTVTAWTARHLRLKPGQRYTLSGGLASMAYALPGAIGAQLANPDKRVFALAGDGAFAMLMGDFVTAVKYDLPIVVLVLNNAKLGFITLEQQSKGLPDYGTDLENPDFATFAGACGGVGFTVDRADQLEKAIEDALAAKTPAAIDVMVDPGALIFPPKLNVSLAMNFGLAKIREAFGA
jgi:thiamine pyrophosphate-dependent acetolactate synthase large subunit-like protein